MDAVNTIEVMKFYLFPCSDQHLNVFYAISSLLVWIPAKEGRWGVTEQDTLLALVVDPPLPALHLLAEDPTAHPN